MRIYDYIMDASLAALLKALWERSLTRCYSKPVVAAKATSDPDLKTTVTLYYSIAGIMYTKTATATIDVSGCGSAPYTAQAAGTYCAYLLVINANGTFNVVKGTDAATAALALAATPAIPASNCPVGIVVVTNTTNPFTIGTTNSDAAGVTFTCYDVADIPPTYGTSAVYLNTVSA